MVVDGDGLYLFQTVYKALVAQISERQCFRVGADGHQGDDLAAIDIQRQWRFARHLDLPACIVFIDRRDRVCRRQARMRDFRSIPGFAVSHGCFHCTSGTLVYTVGGYT